MKLGSVAASASGTYTLEYVPQFVGIKFSTGSTLDSITVTTDEGTITNLNGDALKAIAQSMSQGDLTDADNVYYVPLAEGYVPNRKCTLYVSTGAGGTGVDVYSTSVEMAEVGILFNTYIFDVIANGNTEINKFSKFGIIGFSNSDVLTLNSNSGSTDRLFEEEILSLASFEYDNQDDYVIFNNDQGNIKNIIYSPSANRTCWLVQAQFEGSKKMSDIVEKVAEKKLTGKVFHDKNAKSKEKNIKAVNNVLSKVSVKSQPRVQGKPLMNLRSR
jgi:hypothetical protein